MNVSLDNKLAKTPKQPLARLAGQHGYRFEGDYVHLNVQLGIHHPAAHERSWALQLWACPNAPTSVGDLAGHKLAEVALPPIGELADETEHFDISTAACLPAGSAEYFMVLTLASGRTGQFDEIHDLQVYPRRESFVLPALRGNVGYRVEGNQVQISVERVANPRPSDNQSGTLSLELWALPKSYQGGAFEGHHVAGVEIGSLSGGNELTLQPIDLKFAPPPAGTWQMVLMLREWSGNGFVTRDFVQFGVPYTSEKEKPLANKPATPVVEAAKVKSIPAPAAPVIIEKPASQKGATPTPPKKSTEIPVVPLVSVNTATLEELTRVPGFTKKIAGGILKKRPFASLEDLRKVKGLGPKILDNARARLKL